MGRGMIEREGARAPLRLLLQPEPHVRGKPDPVRDPDGRGVRDRRDRPHHPREGARRARYRDDLPRHVPASADHERPEEPAMTAERVSSFSKSLALGEIHEDVVFPYPIPRGAEADKVRRLIEGFRAYAAEHIDSREIDETGTISDRVYRDLGDLGLMGLYVDEAYGGQGLSQTGYARVFEAIGQVDGSLTIGMGVHQSIGLKGIHLFGTDEQKARFLPDLASGRKLAGFALTEPEAGSDAYNIQTRAVQQSDGSWLLNGEKRWIGNGCRGDVLTVFARADVDGRDSHIALILEKGMDGFDQSGPRYETMGLRGN